MESRGNRPQGEARGAADYRMLESANLPPAMHLILVVPALLDQPSEALARNDLLARLAARAQVRAADDLDDALLDALALAAPVAPLAALGAGLDVDARWWMRADPVSISVGHDDVRILGLVDDLDAGESAALLALLSRHFDADGLRFHAPRPDAWFVSSATPFEVRTTPLAAALERPLRDKLPAGSDAPRWRRWMTEVQMLLHDHALAQRPARPVSALWFSHAGTLPPRASLPPVRVAAEPARSADLSRGLAQLAGGTTAMTDALDDSPADVTSIVVSAPITSEAALASTLQTLVAPALARLDSKRLARLTLIGDGAGTAAAWQATPSGWLDRVRRRRGHFTVPEAR